MFTTVKAFSFSDLYDLACAICSSVYFCRLKSNKVSSISTNSDTFSLSSDTQRLSVRLPLACGRSYFGVMAEIDELKTPILLPDRRSLYDSFSRPNHSTLLMSPLTAKLIPTRGMVFTTSDTST